jgi:putative phosphonate metabolism protein
MPARFAIFLVPPAASPLWERGCRWLGRDPESAAIFDQPAVPGMTVDEIRDLTRSPGKYGFHGTLKAPFRLAADVDEVGLLERVRQVAGALPALAMPPMQVDSLNGFLALRPAGDHAALDALAQRFVTRLDDLRAPLDTAERARRLSSGLSARQRELLDRWGYPYVLAEFRFHMTLSGPLDSTRAARLRPWLAEWFEPALAEPAAGMEVGVFAQSGTGAAFALRRRFRIGA